jgi:hypothetical protein
MLYYATAFDPPLDLFRSHGIELSEEVEEIRRELPIGTFPDRAIGPRTKRIMASARDLGYDWQKLDKFVHPEKCDSGVPYEAKWNARAYVRDAQRDGAVLETRARVDRVLVENGTAVGVEFRRGGGVRRAYADRVIVSAGGVGSPVILRASGIENVGEGFFCDPLVIVNGAVDDVAGPSRRLHDDRPGPCAIAVLGVHRPTAQIRQALRAFADAQHHDQGKGRHRRQNH